MLEHERRTILAMATPIVAFDLATRTLYVPQSRDAIDLVLALATGADPEVGWRVYEPDGPAFCVVAAHERMRPVALAFRSPDHDALLVAVARERRFALHVEGCIPVDIPVVERRDDVLRPFLANRGWR